MSEIDVKAAEAKLSKSAANLLQRLRKGRWYPVFPSAIGKETPAAMEELIKAGLVGSAARAKVIVACYVPAHGYTPMQMERFE